MSTGRSQSQPDRSVGSRRALEHAVLGLLPILLIAFVISRIYASGTEAVDFQHSFWVAGWRVLHGLDPYAWSRRQIMGGVSFPYPALAALLMAPLGLASSFSESIPITVAGLLAAPLSLRILGVRDWRVYGATAMWGPVVIGWQTANFTLPLVVGTALLWRYRDRRWMAAVLIACLVSIKPILVPLWIWLVLTRRRHAAALGAVIGILLNAVAWTVLGWHELSGWLHLISLQGKLQDSTGYSLIAVATHLGLSRTVGDGLMILFVGGVLAILVASAKANREVGAFGAAVLLTIGVSPQVDSHYFAVLLVPLALRRPTLSWPWLVPIVLWACPATQARGWQIGLWWSLVAALAVGALLLWTRRESDAPGKREGRMLDLAMAQARSIHQRKSSLQLRSDDHGTRRVWPSWPTTSMGSQPIVQDNESTDTPLSRDGKI